MEGRGARAGHPRRARMGAYALWQLRDYMMERGISTLLIGVFLGLQFILPLRLALRPQLGPDWASDPLVRAQLEGIVAQLALSFAGLGTLVAVNGIVSNDRKFGYFRLVFAKPVSVARYYGQAFLVHLVGLCAAAALLAAAFGLLVAPAPVARVVLLVAAVAIGIGGVGFLLSTLVRFDWLALSLVTIASLLAHLYYGRSGDWRAWLVTLLPPVHKLDPLASAILGRGALDRGELAWFLGYGAACVLAGLIVVRRRPLAA